MLLLAVVQVPRVPRSDECALELPDKDRAEVCLVVNASVDKLFDSCSLAELDKSKGT